MTGTWGKCGSAPSLWNCRSLSAVEVTAYTLSTIVHSDHHLHNTHQHASRDRDRHMLMTGCSAQTSRQQSRGVAPPQRMCCAYRHTPTTGKTAQRTPACTGLAPATGAPSTSRPLKVRGPDVLDAPSGEDFTRQGALAEVTRMRMYSRTCCACLSRRRHGHLSAQKCSATSGGTWAVSSAAVVRVRAGPFRLDLGDVLYAPNAFVDPAGRTLMLAWLQELRSGGTYKYAGCLSVPRVLTLRGQAFLCIAPSDPHPETPCLSTSTCLVHAGSLQEVFWGCGRPWLACSSRV